ncbi:MAG: hypothetical protein M1835_000162 [Candelina submexicana]|nr:MAG: hypothetical protein M1835_000162 [Candelina submexicana]
MSQATIDFRNDPHEAFTAWAIHKGVTINAVVPTRFRGRGIGVAAACQILKGETLATVPISAMLSVDTMPQTNKTGVETSRGVTVHGLLAGYLTVDIDNPSSSLTIWRATWPSAQDVHDTMPLLWPKEARALLPPNARVLFVKFFETDQTPALLSTQEQKLQTDFASVSKILPCQDKKQSFTYHWLLVNTRTLYYVSPFAKKELPPVDRIALCPFIDYFNHADVGCQVEFDANGYKVIADRTYEPGEEIHVTYAKRSNDYLLIECTFLFPSPLALLLLRRNGHIDGFILPKNRWDELSLDHLILQRLTDHQQGELRNAGYYGNYVLNGEGVCYRTQVAMRLLVLPFERWQRFVLGEEDEEQDQILTNERIVRVLLVYANEAKDKLQKLRILPPTFQGPQAVLTARWTQIHAMLTDTIRTLSA